MGKFLLQSKVGSLGENLGCRYLKRNGYKILDTNYCNTFGRRLGEIDIIAQKKKEIVFVEVKTRYTPKQDDIAPEDSITPAKLRKLERIAKHYLREKHQESATYHFDALSIIYNRITQESSVRHLEHIFF